MPDFDEMIDRRGTACNKWDEMQLHYGISPDEGLAMWVADMDFRPPAGVTTALQKLVDHGIYGYPATQQSYTDAIIWWMQNRHGWQISADQIINVHGLVNGTALAIDAYTEAGDSIILMTPVYHAFARIIRAADRNVTELPLKVENDRHILDWPEWEGRMTGRETMLLLCSPHNPGGRVWTPEELREIADFAKRHDLIVVSDEIHHDLVLPGSPRHHVLATVAPDIEDRLVTLTSSSKTFNIAGAHIGNAIIADPGLRRKYEARNAALGLSQGMFGMPMVTAAYSPEGAEWLDALLVYLDENRKVFDAGIAAIPGLKSMPLEATYLSWVDFSGTGMTREEFTRRVQTDAGIASNHGPAFGNGGESWMRFNLATPRKNILLAVERLQKAFADLQ